MKKDIRERVYHVFNIGAKAFMVIFTLALFVEGIIQEWPGMVVFGFLALILTIGLIVDDEPL